MSTFSLIFSLPRASEAKFSELKGSAFLSALLAKYRYLGRRNRVGEPKTTCFDIKVIYKGQGSIR